MISKYDHYDLSAQNTFRMKVSCACYVEYDSMDDLKSLDFDSLPKPLLSMGEGSNMLFTRDFEGTVLRSRIGYVKYFDLGADEVPLAVGSGVKWDDLVAKTCADGLWGLENLSLIPGDVGASAVQNIGAYGVEAKDFICQVHAVEIATGRRCVFSNEDCRYGYRDSRFKHEWKNRYLITSVEYALQQQFAPRLHYGNISSELERRGIGNPTAQQVRDVIIDIRNAKLPDPKVMGNAGSFFMNPIVSREKYESLAAQYEQMPHYEIDASHVKIPAGWMIEQCGWKGQSLGRAGVYEKQALVLVNRGGATGDEIVTLCRQIQHDVQAKFGIDIHPEVNII